MWNGRGREKSKETAFGPSFLVNGSFVFLRREAVCLGEGKGALLFGHDKLKMLITATSGQQRRGSGYKFGHHRRIVRTQYRKE